MTALAADPRSPGKRPLPGYVNHQVVNASVMYKDAFAALCTPTHGTAASRGRVKPWSGAAGEFLLGRWSDGKTTGDTSATPIVNGKTQLEDVIVENVAVAGLASSEFQRDALKYVYCGDDNMPAAMTLTRPAAPNDRPVGIVWAGKTASVCDVLIFGVRTQMLLAMCGGPVQTWFLGCVSAETPSAQNLLTGLVAPFHGVFLSTFSVCIAASTDADWTQLVNLEIDGVDVTGGVITQATADAQGDKQSGTAITGTNEFAAGSLIDVEAASVTAGTANNGLYGVYAKVELRLGL